MVTNGLKITKENNMQPNLREYSTTEAADLGHKWMELEEAGLHEEAEKIQLEIPLLPGLANNMKQEIGIEAMIEMGINLSEAVKEYGHEWLEQ